MLHHHSKHDLNMRGAFLHMVADTASSIGVIIAGVLVFALGFFASMLNGVLFLTGVWGYSMLKAGLAITPGPVTGRTTRMSRTTPSRSVSGSFSSMNSL